MPREIVSMKDVINPANPANTSNDFKDRLVKLIPSEIVTAYVTVQGILKGAAVQGDKDKLLWIVFIILFCLTPVYLYVIGSVRKWSRIIFTTIAFVIWVIVIGGPIEKILGFDAGFIGSILLVLYTLFIPLLYKGRVPSLQKVYTYSILLIN